MAKPLIVGNWKLYINSLVEAKKLLSALDKKLPKKSSALIVVCPQVPLAIALKVGYRGRRIAFGAQDAFFESEGAHTGEASPHAFAEGGIEYVILGHSEQRALGETNEIVAKKAATALREKLKPIICVGERERDTNGLYLNEFRKDIFESLSRLEATDASKIVVAYEPVWAIGGEETPEARTILETSVFIRKTLAEMWGRDAAFKVRIIYGGSVNAANAPLLVKEAKVSGVLVGHHSTDADSFATIVRAFS